MTVVWATTYPENSKFDSLAPLQKRRSRRWWRRHDFFLSHMNIKVLGFD